MKHIAVFDFGSQYTHLIARSIRDLNVLAIIYPADTKPKELKGRVYGIILSGGPQSVYGEDSLRVDPEIFSLGVPVLGLCYGHQLMGQLLGGSVERGDVGEYGKALMQIEGESKIFEKIVPETTVWMSHGDSVVKVPEGFSIIGSTKDCKVTAMSDERRNFFGFQFHPEVMHTAHGEQMLENFVITICKSEREWKVKDLIEDLVEKIKKQVGDRKVFILVSGGVDSNVAFALLTKALGESRVRGLYIDTGFMRKGESERIMENFEKIGFGNLEMVDASEKFITRLKGIYDPEEKRHIIGQTFLDVKDEAVKKLGLDPEHWILGQGTIYPDTIESGGTKHADKIKTHHNRVDAIQELIDKGLVIEPLVDFYKDEVRKIGELLDVPKKLIDRHPFPGPGLAIRMLCYEPTNKIENTSPIEQRVGDLLRAKNTNISFRVLPIKSVGVQGDSRTYAHPLVVWGETNWERLDEIASTVTNSIKEINRVILVTGLQGKDNPEFELPTEGKYLTEDRADLLRDVDAIVNSIIRQENVYDDIWQFPVVLLPILDYYDRESIVLRPFNSRDVMTFNFYRMEQWLLNKIAKTILETGKVSYVFYDITNKPPGTTEWE